MIYLFNPMTYEKTPTSYDLICGITGKTKSSLMTYKCRDRKIKEINCYIIDDETRLSKIQEYMSKETPSLEIWKDITDSTNNWQVSNYGRFRYIKGGKYRFGMVAFNNKTNNLNIQIRTNGERKTYQPHVIVAKYFLDKPIECLVLRHIDGNKWNNRDDNLEYVSRQWLGRRTGASANSIAVVKIDPVTDEVIGEYTSMRAASRANFLCHGAVAESIRQNRLCAGYKYKIADI